MYKYKFQITFRLEHRNKLRSDGTKTLQMHNVPIWADITFRGNRLNYYTGIRVNRKDWKDSIDEVTGRRTQYVCNAEYANASMSNIREVLKRIFFLFEEYGTDPTPQRVRQELRRRLNNDSHTAASFCKAVDTFIEEQSRHRMWKSRTIENYNVLRNHCHDYLSDATIDDINEQWLDGFVEYLYEKHKLRNSTINMLLQQLKAVIRWLVLQNKINEDIKVTNYHPRLIEIGNESNVVALTQKEMHLLLQYKPRNKREQYVRDIFCFCCATSLRYSDVMRLQWSNITDDAISMVTLKTNEYIYIPINKTANSILSSYRTRLPGNHNADSLVFIYINKVSYNRCLKNIGKRAGLNRMTTRTYFIGSKRYDEIIPLYNRLSSHVARKTFVSHGLASGVPADVICSFTGHRDQRQLKYYCRFTTGELTKWMNIMHM